jgi:ankyrin repeat protein
MFPNPQDALPIPPNSSLEDNARFAEELAAACESSRSESIRNWVKQWVEALVRLSGLEITPELPVRTERWVDQVDEFARGKLLGSEPNAGRCTLAGAQFVIARAHGFESWEKLAEFLNALAQEGSTVSRFEAAAEAIISGDADTLARVLAEEPELVHVRSMREHGATLLLYASANGVEGYRQKTPKNIVAIADLLLRAGADVEATASVYESDCTTLGLVATSVHPERAGVQEALLQTLLDHGASMDRPATAGRTGSIVTACLANGQPKAAEFLASRGAAVDLDGAAGLGRFASVRSYFEQNGQRQPSAKTRPTEAAYEFACWYGHADVVDFLLDQGIDPAWSNKHGQTGLHCGALGAHVEIVKLLLARGAPVDANDKNYGATPLEAALWAWQTSPDGAKRERCYEVIALLMRSGAQLDPRQWQDRIGSDPRMLAVLRGEFPAD